MFWESMSGLVIFLYGNWEWGEEYRYKAHDRLMILK